ncbi:MAG: 8-oxo-dGTP diphosphatase [Candidatus Micrarchaeota archaeon]|nr:8-oxo-dGTP diphosphatase [Candidatus Micrarchaeota archaeon]
MPVESAMCFLLDGDKVLLIRNSRGNSKGKWLGLGGKLDKGETPRQAIIREIREESGIEALDASYHGKTNFYMDGGKELGIVVHIFSSRNFRGEPKSTEEGELKWFRHGEFPFDQMWDDTKYWMDLPLEGRRFTADFYYDKSNEKVVRHDIRIEP